MHWLNTVIGAKIISPLIHWALFFLSERKMYSWCSAWLWCLGAESLCHGWNYCRDLVFQQKESGMVPFRGGRCKLSCLRRAGSLRAVSPVTANSFSSQFLPRPLLCCWFAKQPLLLFPYFRKFCFFRWCHFGDAVSLHPVFFELCSLRVSSCKKMWIKKHMEMHLSALLTLLNLLVSSMFSFSSTLSLLSPRQL